MKKSVSEGKTTVRKRIRAVSKWEVGKKQPEKSYRIPWQEIFGVFVIAVGFFVMFTTINPHLTGKVGFKMGDYLIRLMGWATFTIPLLVIITGSRMLYPFKLHLTVFFTIMSLVFIWSTEILRCLIIGSGGTLGCQLRDILVKNLGDSGTIILLVVFMLISFMLFIGMSVKDIIITIWRVIAKLSIFIAKGTARIYAIVSAAIVSTGRIINGGDRKSHEEIISHLKEAATVVENMNIMNDRETAVEKRLPRKQKKEDEKASVTVSEETIKSGMPYKIPPLSMLAGIDSPKAKKASGDYSTKLVETLESFGVAATVSNIERGPSITRYEMIPAPGVKVAKITNLTNDIALALAAPSIRIEAPVKGKSCIGIEVPNDRIDVVNVKEILESEEFKNKDAILPLAFGKDITGKCVVGDLVRMPHLLVAGSTGSGKSVCINCIVASLLFKAFPTEVQLVMIDPKRVELSVYEGIPHLIDIKASSDKRIITDPKIATLVLQQMTEIMDARYDQLANSKARNIFEYNQKSESKLPYLVIIVDELADLMMVSANTVEKYICRIAQMGRAAGIHLILATQRPSVDVITGIIKANIPSRIAFAVASQVDSRTILDMAGAEKLLGKGDMLYLPSDASVTRRVQGAYVSLSDIESIVAFWQEQPAPDNLIPIDIEQKEASGQSVSDIKEDDQDELFQEALRIIMQERHASVSILQRKLKIGYARAGRIIDIMERKGIVGPAIGSKSRKILAGAGNEIAS